MFQTGDFWLILTVFGTACCLRLHLRVSVSLFYRELLPINSMARVMDLSGSLCTGYGNTYAIAGVAAGCRAPCCPQHCKMFGC
jgi:hypothetical protein